MQRLVASTERGRSPAGALSVRVRFPILIFMARARTNSSPATSPIFTVITGRAKAPPPRFRLRRHHVVRAVAGLLALVTLSFFGCEPAYRGTLVVGAPRPLVLAHRGFGDHGPDNSLAAVQQALDLDMDGADVDGQLTEDGELVMAATTHTFEDLVRAVKGRGILMVELEAPGLGSTGIERRAVEIIQKYDAHLSVVLSSFNPLVLYRVKQLDQFVRTALIATDATGNPEPRAGVKQGDPGDLPWVLRQEFIRRGLRKIARPDLLSIDHRVDEAVIDRLIAKGWPVFIWTTDSEPDIRRWLAKRPHGLISNRPILAKQLRDR
jgi:glycerophosphoryl diester phosphodiesterase